MKIDRSAKWIVAAAILLIGLPVGATVFMSAISLKRATNWSSATAPSVDSEGFYNKNGAPYWHPNPDAGTEVAVGLFSSGVSAGSYANANITVGADGRVTSAVSGQPPAGGGYTTLQSGGSNLTQRAALNFTSVDSICTDNSGSARTDCAITPLGWYNVRNFGAKGDGSTDDSAAFQAAATAACSVNGAVNGGAVVYLPATPSASYYVTTAITIPCSYVTVRGARHTSTVIKFDPSSAASVFTFGVADTVERYGDAISNLTFVSTGTNTQQKTAVTVIDISGFSLEDIWVDPRNASTWTSTSGTSIGLLIEGREIGSFGRFRAFTDKPIVFRDDPNTSGTVDNDQMHLYDLYLRSTPSSGNAAITIENNQIVTNLNLDGVQEYVVDKYGINATDTSSSTISAAWRIQGVRCEQAVDSTGYCINIVRSGSSLQNLVLDDVSVGINHNGVNLAGVIATTIRNSSFPANSNANTHLNIGSNVFSVALENNYVQVNALSNFGGLTQASQAPLDFNSGATMPVTGLYLNSTAATIFKALATASIDSVNGSTQLCIGCTTAPTVAVGLSGAGNFILRTATMSSATAGGTTIGGGGGYMNDVRSRHFSGQGTAPVPTAGTGAGTSPTLTVTGTDSAGKIALTLGTTPAGSNATVVTMAFNTAYNSNAPYCQITPSNAATVALTGTNLAFVDQASGSASQFVIKSGTVALSGGPLLWNYDCTQ